MGGETSSTKPEQTLEALLSEKQALLNVTGLESKGGFVKKLRRLLLLEKSLSQKNSQKNK
jgi:hypothetical protein